MLVRVLSSIVMRPSRSLHIGRVLQRLRHVVERPGGPPDAGSAPHSAPLVTSARAAPTAAAVSGNSLSPPDEAGDPSVCVTWPRKVEREHAEAPHLEDDLELVSLDHGLVIPRDVIKLEAVVRVLKLHGGEGRVAAHESRGARRERRWAGGAHRHARRAELDLRLSQARHEHAFAQRLVYDHVPGRRRLCVRERARGHGGGDRTHGLGLNTESTDTVALMSVMSTRRRRHVCWGWAAAPRCVRMARRVRRVLRALTHGARRAGRESRLGACPSRCALGCQAGVNFV